MKTKLGGLTLIAVMGLGVMMITPRSVAAQTRASEPVVLRGFAGVPGQAFAAKDTVEAAFGQSVQPFYGGGIELVSGTYFLDLGASRFHKDGQRAFIFEGETFPLGIPLSVTITPVEFTFGYRFNSRRAVVPYAGGGIGSYRYQEESPQAENGDDIDTREIGYLAVGGVEFRTARWLRIAVDVQYSYVPDILGEGGISAAAGESDLGGVAARLKFVLGR